MATRPQPGLGQPQQPQMDQGAVNLAKAIRQTESNGNFNAVGDNGTSKGAYQWQAPTWKSHAEKILGNPNAEMTPQNQNAVAYGMIKTWKDQGLNTAQIAAAWNSGSPDGWENKIGTKNINGKTISYNVPKYVKSVTDAYQTIKGGGNVGIDPNNPSATSDANSVPTPPQKSIGGFIGNAVSSGANVIGGLANVVLHPIDTAKGIGQAITHPGLVGNMINERYGVGDVLHGDFGKAADKIGNTLYTDPIGALLDASTVLGGAGAGIKAVGTAGKLGEFANIANKAERAAAIANAAKAGEFGTAAKIGQGLLKASEVTDPIAMGVKAVGGFGRAITKISEPLLGFTTGVGTQGIRSANEAIAAGGAKEQAFTDALRGKTTGEDLLATTEQAQKSLVKERSATYKTDLINLDKETMVTKNGQLYVKKIVTAEDVAKGNAPASSLGKEGTWVPTDLSTKGLKDVSTRSLKELGIDSSGSSISNAVKRDRPSMPANKMQRVVDTVYNWDDLSPSGLDNLKQEIRGFRKGGIKLSPSEARYNKWVDDLSNNIMSYAQKRVPQLEKLNKTYAAGSVDIGKLKTIIGGAAAPETKINRLIGIIKEDKGMRLSLIKQVEAKTGQSIEAVVAGIALSSGIPRGVVGRLMGGLEGLAIVNTLHPGAVFGMLASSPRVVGELLKVMGKGNRAIERLGDLVSQQRGFIQAGFQAGRNANPSPQQGGLGTTP